MLTRSHVCCAFSSARALSLNVICIFEMACSKPISSVGMFLRYNGVANNDILHQLVILLNGCNVASGVNILLINVVMLLDEKY